MTALLDRMTELRVQSETRQETGENRETTDSPNRQIQTGGADENLSGPSCTGSEKADKPSESAGGGREARASHRGAASDIRIADCCIRVPEIPADMNCSGALAVFRANEEAPCAVVTGEDGLPAGLLMRDAFFRMLTGRYAPELYYDRPAGRFADAGALTVDAGTAPGELIRSALARGEKQFYDCIIVTKENVLFGVMTVKDLMILSGKLQEKAEEERRLAVADSYSHVDEIGTAVRKAAAAAELSREECDRMLDWIGLGSEKLGGVKESYSRVDERMRLQQTQVTELISHVTRISSMTGEIGEIANRSSLLAMNATIEAAHAGEHGRGFQVVAGEVRSLALQTRELSATIIKLLQHIGDLAARAGELAMDGVSEVGSSARIVEEAGQLFGSLHDAVGKVEQAGKQSFELTRRGESLAAGVKSRLGAMAGGLDAANHTPLA